MAFFEEPFVSVTPDKNFDMPSYEPFASMMMTVDYINAWNPLSEFYTEI